MSTTAMQQQDAPSGARRQLDLKLEVITIPVSDLDRAKAFYEDLGWRLDADFRSGDQRVIQFTPPGSPCSIRRGAAVSDVFHYAAGDLGAPVPGTAPGHQSYGSYATFSDPDGNGWILQEVTTRLPGRVAGDTTYASVSELAQALRRAEAAHGEHEKRSGGQRDENWPAWYAEYMVREQSGEALPV